MRSDTFGGLPDDYILLSGAPNKNKGTGGDSTVGFDFDPIRNEIIVGGQASIVWHKCRYRRGGLRMSVADVPAGCAVPRRALRPSNTNGTPVLKAVEEE
ncbi:hypothetical protein QJS10_CPA05g01390 [Acorus calamus]|uniref:Uncharacterized protein n=1 Tax=Acorus calamus TaxID=4465 RepID=A0AAV9EX26_ACOCL|nr:hypothetical protein QJS10_CPA05g01390 [Acorus calamus]